MREKYESLSATVLRKDKALAMHKEWNGKLETIAKSKVNSREDLAIAYTPGVAEPCKVIAEDKEAAYTYTMKANTVAVISDGSAVLGLGNIGPYAAMPIMEGKCVLFKEFGDVNAVPICLDTQDTEEIIATIKNIAPAFGGINLEDISAPRCFEIEERLKEMLDIPVFHDTSGMISGTGFAIAKRMESLFMEATISGVTIFGAETPTKISAPFNASASVPEAFSKFVTSVIFFCIQFKSG